MPSNWLTTDSNLPTFTGDESVKEKLEVVLEYMVTLTENLRYSLQNLGEDNWNDSKMKEFTQKVTAGISQQLHTVQNAYSQILLAEETYNSRNQMLEESVRKIEEGIAQIQRQPAQLRPEDLQLLNNLFVRLESVENAIRGESGLAQRVAELEGITSGGEEESEA